MDDPIERIILSQTVAVLPNRTYDIGFWVGTDNPIGTGVDIGLGQHAGQNTQIFVDGTPELDRTPQTFMAPTPYGGTAVYFPLFPGTGPDDFRLAWGQFDSASRTSVDVAFAINAGGFVRPVVSFDDFFLQEHDPKDDPVPEPGTLSLLLLGLVPVSRLLRRHA
jgi:hypothetical protein